MSEQSFNNIPENEISLKDIIDFFAESWRSIILAGLLGLVGSISYLWVTPNQYQASAQIKIAQISNNNTLSVNIEDPILLMSRLKFPATYSAQEIKACGFDPAISSYEALAAAVKFSDLKGIGSIIELKVNRDSKEVAIACVQALFENIKAYQNKAIGTYIDEIKVQLVKYQDSLTNTQSLLSKNEKSELTSITTYLAIRDEIIFLNEEIFRLKTFIRNAENNQARLVSPIYSSGVPVFPNRKTSLIVGLMIGLCLGLLFVLGKKAHASFRSR